MTKATLTERATIKEAGYTVAKLDSGFGPAQDAWTLADPDGNFLMIGGHGCVSPAEWEAIAEGLKRIEEN